MGASLENTERDQWCRLTVQFFAFFDIAEAASIKARYISEYEIGFLPSRWKRVSHPNNYQKQKRQVKDAWMLHSIPEQEWVKENSLLNT